MTPHWTLPPTPFSPKARLIVAVSGGSDSLGLLYLLRQEIPDAPERFIVAHVNYGMRGMASDGDEQMVRRICHEQKFLLRALRVSKFKERVRKEKRSPQDLAREIRYSFFQRLAKKERAWGVVVAHHQEDQAETVLDRLLRGTGVKGLSGLRPVQTLTFVRGHLPLRIWRPLLQLSKTQIQDYLRSRDIPWREDRTNKKGKYRRNQIRQEVLPFLSRWNPRLTEVLSRLGEISAVEDAFLEDLVASVGKRIQGRWAKNSFYCRSSGFKKIPLALKRRWVRFVAVKLTDQARGLSFERIDEAIRLWEGTEKGPRDLGFGLSAGRSQNTAFLIQKERKRL